MKRMYPKFYLALLSTTFSLITFAQSKPTIPFSRLIWHENIDKAQKQIDKLDGKEDRLLVVNDNETTTKNSSNAAFKRVDDLQNTIELDSTLDNNGKIKFLRGLNEVLSNFDSRVRMRSGIKKDDISELVNSFVAALPFEKNQRSIATVIQQSSVGVSEILMNSFAYSKNVGIAESRDVLLKKTMLQNPNKIMPTLQKQPNLPYADSLIKVVAYRDPEELYTYAQSPTEIGRRIQRHPDSLVKMVSKLSKLNSGRLFFPFLDNLYRGKMTMEDVQKNMDNKYKYYRMLVNTEIEYAGRFNQGDTPLVFQSLKAMLKKKSVEEFINVINALHDSPDAVRMREVEPLNSQELYYLVVNGDPDIYTSSYLKVYDRIFQRMKNPSSDTLLMSVKFDYFKKFIKMAAGYNRLDHFLKNMAKGNAEILMRSFASGLEKTATLEDAVDVADSYASIADNELRKLILDEVQASYTESAKTKNKRGVVIYDILKNVFESMDSTSNVDISARFGIPPVYSVKNAALKDTSGRIIIQQFFYGDKDGNTVFNFFKNAYRNANWKIVDKPEWIEVSTTGGTPVTIYSNKPLDSEKDLDAKAQADLGEYLIEKGLDPTVVIHRGHSYFVNYTIDQLPSSAQVVLLGSCGGYHNLHGVLERSPYAHIIASKQVGSGTINQPMIISMTETLRQGKDLNWPQMWKEFSTMFKKNDLFDDYVPPHKNLGAIFIMAYNKIADDSRRG
jgi:hypothetical protein